MPKSTESLQINGKYPCRNEFRSTIRALDLCMNFLGLWPRTTPSIWYTLLWCVQSVGLLFQLFGPIAGTIIRRHDVNKTFDSLGIVIPMTFILIKWITFTVRKKTIGKLFNFMEEDWINLEKNTSVIGRVPDSKLIMTKYSRSARMFFYLYVTMMALAVANFVRGSVKSISNSRSDTVTGFDDVLPIPNSWYPVDYNRSLNVQILAITQTYTSMITALANGCLDGVFVVFTLHLCGQLKILGYFIETIACDSSRLECCRNETRLMVQRHQELLSAAKQIQESYSLMFLEHLTASTLTSCFLGYSILVRVINLSMIQELEKTEPDMTTLLKSFILYGVTMQTIFYYCLAGDYVTNESSAISMAAYSAPWYNFPRSISVSFLIVMIRAERSIEITGAKLLPMSLESFAVIMKTALSYLSVLRAIGVDNVTSIQ